MFEKDILGENIHFLVQKLKWNEISMFSTIFMAIEQKGRIEYFTLQLF